MRPKNPSLPGNRARSTAFTPLSRLLTDGAHTLYSKRGRFKGSALEDPQSMPCDSELRHRVTVPTRLSMRYLIAVIASSLIFGFLVPRGVLLMASRPQQPQVVDAGSEARDSEGVQNAVGVGALHEDLRRRAVRQAVLNAANRVEASPCDTRQRRLLSDAFDAYQSHMAAT